MALETPLVDDTFLLEKYPGKGGWTYTVIPGISADLKKAFGFVRVRGSIDGFPVSAYNLMPMKSGSMFLPVKAEIRKKIKKEAGDSVRITLFHDELPLDLPEEFMLCLKDEPLAWKQFNESSDSVQKAIIDWIYSAKKEETKIERMAESITNLSVSKKWRP